MALPLHGENAPFHGARRRHGNAAHRLASRGAPAGVQEGAGKSILTGKEKQHIRTETKPIVTRASFFKNCARASDECVDEAVNKKLAAATAWPKGCQAGGAQAR